MRIVQPLSKCRMTSFSGKTLYTYEIPKTSISRLIFGWNMSSASTQAIEDFVKDRNPAVEVWRANFKKGKVCLAKTPRADF